MTFSSFSQVPLDLQANMVEWIRQIASAVNSLRDGKVNSRGEVTLRASQTTTVVVDTKVGGDSAIVLSPMTANAAGAIATTYVSTVDKGTFTLTHASNGQTDKTFRYVALG
jgi:hypothetical protein